MPFQKRGNSGGGWKGGGKSFGDKKPWDRGGDRGGFGGNRGFDKPEMHRATCAKCNQSCEVPFRPNGSRPVFCSNCFKRDDRVERDFGTPSFNRVERDKPSFDRPSSGYNPDMKSAELIKEQFRTVNAKLDTILKALTKTAADEIAEDEAELDGIIIPQEIVTEAKEKKAKKATKKKK